MPFLSLLIARPRSLSVPLNNLDLPGFRFRGLRQVDLQYAVGELRRNFVFLNSFGNAQRTFPGTPDPFVPAEPVVGHARRRRPFALQIENAAADSQFEIFRGDS